MDLAKLATTALEHDAALDDAEKALVQAQEAFEEAHEKAAHIGRLVTGDLPSFSDWVSNYSAVALGQIRGRIRALRKDSANFRARIANKIDAARRARNRGV